MAPRYDPFEALEDQPALTGGVHHPYTAFNQGWDGAERGCSPSLNPYDLGTRERWWWDNGWEQQGDYEDELDGEPVGPTMEEAGETEMDRQWEEAGFY